MLDISLLLKKQLGFIDLFWLTNEEDNVPYWILYSIKIKKVITRRELEKAVFQILERYPVLLSRLVHSNNDFYFEYPDQSSGINIQEYLIAEKGSQDSVLKKLALKPYDETTSPMFYVHHITQPDSTILIIRNSHVFLDGASISTLLAILVYNLLSRKLYLPEFRFEVPENYIRQITSNISGIKFPGRFKRYLIGVKEFLYLLIRHPFKPQIFNTAETNQKDTIYRTVMLDNDFIKVVRSIRSDHDIGSNTILNFLILSAYSIVTGNKKLVNVYHKNIRNEDDFTLGNLISPNFVSFEHTPETKVIDRLVIFNEVIQAEIKELENLFVMYLGKIYPSKTLKNAKKEGEKSANGNVHTSNMGRFPPYSVPNSISKEFEKFELSDLKLYVRPKSRMAAIFNLFRLKDSFFLGLSYVPELEHILTEIVDLVLLGAKKLESNLYNPISELFVK